MRKVAKGFLALLCTTFATQAFAQEYETLETVTTQSYVSMMPYAVDQDSNRVINDDGGVGVRVLYGRVIKENWYWEGQFADNTLETGVNGATDYYQAHLGLDIAYRFGDEEGYRPFVLVGAGAVYDDVFPVRSDRPQDDDVSLFFNVGAGFISREIGRAGVRVRGEVRYVSSQFDAGFDDWHYGIGIELPLGRTNIITRIRTEQPMQNRVRVQTVATQPADSDGDGVVDGIDRCPNTLKGAQVDQFGCVKKQVLQLDGVFFESNSSQLRAASAPALKKLTEFMKGQPDAKVEIAGHTDSVGAASYNKMLSQKRADKVKASLTGRGIDASRMKSVGYGESQPLTTNETSEGRAQNRRVEFRIER